MPQSRCADSAAIVDELRLLERGHGETEGQGCFQLLHDGRLDELEETRHLAAELGPHHIRVNALVPGPFPAQVADAAFGERLAAKTMLGRLGRPEEIGGPLLFLEAPASSYVTGAAIAVDGGWTAW